MRLELARGASRRRRAGRAANARWRPRVGAVEVERVRVGEDLRVAVGGGDRDEDEVAGADRRAADLGVGGGVAVDHGGRGLEPQRLLDRARQQRRRPPAPRASASGRSSRCASALAIIPSVVSIPPNSSTAAFDTASSQSARVARGGGEQRGRRRALERSASTSRAPRSRGPAVGGRPGADLGHGGDDRVVPAEHASPVGVLEPERSG